MQKIHNGITTLAIVGTFGCGKTTFFRELQDAYQVLKDPKVVFHFTEEFAKKVFTTMEPFCSTPTEKWPPEYYKQAQSVIIPGMIQDDRAMEQKEGIHVVESYWVNVLPYTIASFGEGHLFTNLVRTRIENTLSHTLYLYLDHEGIPLDPTNRHPDYVFRQQVATQVRNILEEEGALYMTVPTERGIRTQVVKKLLSHIQENKDDSHQKDIFF